MKYLNKIIFINSADKSLKYAEVNLDGNVHFIGTQGVGKSTLLRSILFFYNADKQKLGIKSGQKTYDEYYFPYQNSYIIYEVKTEHGFFCVLTFKSQGRVAFRFFDSEFDKKFFLDNEGKAFDTWDKTLEVFGKNISCTRIISSYEEYRNILYGNNKGLSVDFRKYSLLESKQYQNIPRTITNVFLNAKLDAEFVKETIIKSLNEDEIKIDLTTYSQTHLKDFENHLSDIKKLTDRNKNGENQIEKLSNKVLELYSSLKFLEKEKEELASQLGWALNNAKEQQPKITELLTSEELKKKKTEDKLKELDNVFEKEKSDIQKQIGEFMSKLKEIKKKKSDYILLNIYEIIARVSKKTVLELESKNLMSEKTILTSAFTEIENKYIVLLQQVENQFKEYENSKQTEKHDAKSNFLYFKESVGKQYETIFENIRTQHKAELETAQTFLKEKDKVITDSKIKKIEVKNKKFYEKEIDACKSEILNLNKTVSDAENSILQAIGIRRNLEKELSLEENAIKEDTNRKNEKQTEKQTRLAKEIEKIDAKIENNKDSLYGWLNEQAPDWEKTIGKVIDEENVLFRSGLNPQKNSNDSSCFYGIQIDLQEISKEVKTIEDLEKEKTDFQSQITVIQKEIINFNSQFEKDLENLRIRFHKKIKDQKDVIQTNEYFSNIAKTKLEVVNVKLTEWENKAKIDKQFEFENIENEIYKLSEEKIKAEYHVTKIENSIEENLKKKRKEKETKIKNEQQLHDDVLIKIDLEILDKKREIGKRENEIKEHRETELDAKGANTKRIGEINLLISEIDIELNFIENNRDKVADYNKDKRELFDKESEFKNQKSLLESQLEIEKEKYERQKSKIIQEIVLLNNEIASINQRLAAFDDDIKSFETFKNSDIFQSIEFFVVNYSEIHETDHHCMAIIMDINQKHYNGKDRFTELQEVINKFTGNFQENNLFKFKTKNISHFDFFEFADNLKEFIEENKISEFKKRFEERFAHIIRQIGVETQQLIEKEGEISQVIRDINNDFTERNFVGAIKSMELRTSKSANVIFLLLVDIMKYNDDNYLDLGYANLFSTDGQSIKNEKAIELLKQLIKAMTDYSKKEILLSDSFELQFKIVENDNDSGWVEKLTNVGSEGTDTLVKAMINILLLNVFKEKADKKNKGDFRLHCMMDEIGKLHPTNVKGILQFANDRNILLINSSPTTYNAADYRYTYLLAKDMKGITNVKRLIGKKS